MRYAGQETYFLVKEYNARLLEQPVAITKGLRSPKNALAVASLSVPPKPPPSEPGILRLMLKVSPTIELSKRAPEVEADKEHGELLIVRFAVSGVSNLLALPSAISSGGPAPPGV